MTVRQVIGNYCRLYGVQEPAINPEETRYFVAISAGESKVFYIRGRLALLGQIIGGQMKRGMVLYVQGRRVVPVTWEKWKIFWRKFFAPKVTDRNPEPNRERCPRPGIFQLMQHRDIPHKPSKRGFERTEIANRSMNML